jgi:hypothetical protein
LLVSVDVGVVEGLVVWIVLKVKLGIKVSLVGSFASVSCDFFEIVGSVILSNEFSHEFSDH